MPAAFTPAALLALSAEVIATPLKFMPVGGLKPAA